LARADVDTLIEGETGVGKELAAHALHTWGPRRTHPFVAIDCAALPSDLVESDLFGHELGAFPGALRKRTGRIEHSDRGTLFLDDVQAMAPDAQAKLLRFLEERQITPLGSNEPRSIDVRVVAAFKTPLDPDAALRPELFHRLNVARIVVPPLRERRGDIPLLFAHFLARASARFSREAPPLGDSVRRRLIEYDWPGNVRELAHFAERVVLNLESDAPQESAAASGLRERIDQFEGDLIREALLSNGGDIRKTIEALSVPRKTFYDKVQRHQIDLNSYRTRRRRPGR
jgi:two-component system C4-dicarboxylate transport response regulator DctD